MVESPGHCRSRALSLLVRDQAAKSFLHNLLLFELFDLSRKTGLVIKLPDSAEMETLFC